MANRKAWLPMSIDVVDLREFYAGRLGAVAKHFIRRGIRKRWTNLAGQRVLGLGYATPYLAPFRDEAERCLAFMPAPQGVVRWPSEGAGLTSLIDELDLPLQEAAVDRVLLVHGLEMSQDGFALLREIYRVLAPGGHMMAVVPNRRGLWARMDTTPFGNGRPYSRSQINALLREAWFTPVSWSEALYVPPISRGWFLRMATAWERTGAALSAPFAGVHIVEATKQVYRPMSVRRERRLLLPALKPALSPGNGMKTRSSRRPAATCPAPKCRRPGLARPLYGTMENCLTTPVIPTGVDLPAPLPHPRCAVHGDGDAGGAGSARSRAGPGRGRCPRGHSHPRWGATAVGHR